MAEKISRILEGILRESETSNILISQLLIFNFYFSENSPSSRHPHPLVLEHSVIILLCIKNKAFTIKPAKTGK